MTFKLFAASFSDWYKLLSNLSFLNERCNKASEEGGLEVISRLLVIVCRVVGLGAGSPMDKANALEMGRFAKGAALVEHEVPEAEVEGADFKLEVVTDNLSGQESQAGRRKELKQGKRLQDRWCWHQ